MPLRGREAVDEESESVVLLLPLELSGLSVPLPMQSELLLQATWAAARQISEMSLIIPGVYQRRQSAASLTN